MKVKEAKQKNPPMDTAPTLDTTLDDTMQSNLQSEQTMKQVHIPLQAKGGIGKTYVAWLISQYILDQEKLLQVIDADPSNATLSGFKALMAQRWDLMDGTVLNESKFDSLIMRIINEDSDFVVDVGASSFISLNNYLIENYVVDLIGEHGKELVIHSVIAGGSHLLDTLIGFSDLVEQMPEQVRFVVWLNQYSEPVISNGKPFEELGVCLRNKHRIHGIVDLAYLNPVTARADMERMLTAKLTFNEINMAEGIDLVKKNRLMRIKKDIYRQLEAVL